MYVILGKKRRCLEKSRKPLSSSTMRPPSTYSEYMTMKNPAPSSDLV